MGTALPLLTGFPRQHCNTRSSWATEFPARKFGGGSWAETGISASVSIDAHGRSDGSPAIITFHFGLPRHPQNTGSEGLIQIAV